MKKILIITIAAMLILAILSIGIMASKAGPAPNSGDGVSDGSGLDSPQGHPPIEAPAPNSGDGIPDGSGF